MTASNIEKRFYSIAEAKITQTDATPGECVPQRLEGYASVFNANSEQLGTFVERMMPGAFKRSLAAAEAGETRIHALWSHDHSQPLGSTGTGKLKLAEDERGLWFSLDVTRLTPPQLDAAKDGDLKVSFGFVCRQDEWLYQDGVTTRNVYDLDLFEISPCILPAYPDTSCALRSLQASKLETRESDKPNPDKIEPVQADSNSSTTAQIKTKLAIDLMAHKLKHRS